MATSSRPSALLVLVGGLSLGGDVEWSTASALKN